MMPTSSSSSSLDNEYQSYLELSNKTINLIAQSLRESVSDTSYRSNINTKNCLEHLNEVDFEFLDFDAFPS